MDPKETPTSPNFTASPLYPHYPSGMTVNSPSPLLTDAPYAWMPHCDTSIPFTWMTNQLDSPSMSSTGVRTPDLPTCDSNCDNPDSFLALHNTVSPLWPSSTVSEDAIHATFDSDHKQQQLNWTSCAHDPFYESYCLSNSSLLHMPFPETFDPTAYEALVVPSEPRDA
ncbi:hypothetical protein CLU79DRAFT_27124 [Phycomyces nitens]|nr:hypothetical protein CLU79DRAFT_27124 [Phycomyces nitens]